MSPSSLSPLERMVATQSLAQKSTAAVEEDGEESMISHDAIVTLKPGRLLPNVPTQLNHAVVHRTSTSAQGSSSSSTTGKSTVPILIGTTSHSLRKIMAESQSYINVYTPDALHALHTSRLPPGSVGGALSAGWHKFPVHGVTVGDVEVKLHAGYQMKRHDVICEPQGVRDRCIFPGNERFRVLVDMYVYRYSKTSGRLGKIEIIKEIISAVYNAGGNFIRRAHEYRLLEDGVQIEPGDWTDIGEFKAREKVGHALRNYLTKSKKQGHFIYDNDPDGYVLEPDDGGGDTDCSVDNTDTNAKEQSHDKIPAPTASSLDIKPDSPKKSSILPKRSLPLNSKTNATTSTSNSSNNNSATATSTTISRNGPEQSAIADATPVSETKSCDTSTTRDEGPSSVSAPATRVRAPKRILVKRKSAEVEPASAVLNPQRQKRLFMAFQQTAYNALPRSSETVQVILGSANASAIACHRPLTETSAAAAAALLVQNEAAVQYLSTLPKTLVAAQMHAIQQQNGHFNGMGDWMVSNIPQVSASQADNWTNTGASGGTLLPPVSTSASLHTVPTASDNAAPTTTTTAADAYIRKRLDDLKSGAVSSLVSTPTTRDRQQPKKNTRQQPTLPMTTTRMLDEKKSLQVSAPVAVAQNAKKEKHHSTLEAAATVTTRYSESDSVPPPTMDGRAKRKLSIPPVSTPMTSSVAATKATRRVSLPAYVAQACEVDRKTYKPRPKRPRLVLPMANSVWVDGIKAAAAKGRKKGRHDDAGNAAAQKGVENTNERGDMLHAPTTSDSVGTSRTMPEYAHAVSPPNSDLMGPPAPRFATNATTRQQLDDVVAEIDIPTAVPARVVSCRQLEHTEAASLPAPTPQTRRVLNLNEDEAMLGTLLLQLRNVR